MNPKRAFPLAAATACLAAAFLFPRSCSAPGLSLSQSPAKDSAAAALQTPGGVPARAGVPLQSPGGKAPALPPGEMECIGRQMAEAAFWFTEREDFPGRGSGMLAANEPQRYGAHVDGSGVKVALWQNGGDASRSTLTFSLVAAAGELVRAPGQSARTEVRRAGGLTEWYENTPAGLEHGFTVTQPAEQIALSMQVQTSLRAELRPDASGVAFLDEQRRTVLRYEKLMAWDAGGTRLPARMELAADASLLTLYVDARGAKFPVTVDPVFTTQTGRLSGAGTAFGDRFGQRVALSGDWLAVAAQTHESTGAVFLYRRNRETGAWQSRGKLTPPSSTRVNNVALSAEWMAVSYTVASNETRVQLYKRIAHLLIGEWEQRQIITNATADSLGAAMEFSGTRLFLGAPLADVFGTNAGLVEVWKVNADELWAQEGTDLPGASQAAAGDAYGTSLSVEGNILAVGAPGREVSGLTDAGSIVMHYRDGATWPFEKRVLATDAPTRRAQDFFGTSLALAGSWLMSGSPLHDGPSNDRLNTGFSGLHSRNTGGDDEWGTRSYATGLTPRSQMSRTVAGFTNVFAVSQYDTALAETAGAVDMWTNSAGDWNRLERIYAADLYTALEFGTSLALDGEHLVVGAPGENIAAGAVYIFNRHQTAGWQVVAQPTIGSSAPSGWTLGGEGAAVAMDGDRLIVGAPATSQTVGLALRPNSGLAYIFERNTGGEDAWRLIRVLTGDDPRSGHRFGASVDIAGDCAVVGAWGEGGGDGQVHVYLRNQGGTEVWGQAALLVGGTDENYGEAVACTDSRIAVGAPDAPGGGRVVLFERHRGGVNNFGFLQTLVNAAPSGTLDEGDRFGAAISMDETHLLIGAPEAEGFNASSQRTIVRAGRAWMYYRTSPGTWALTDELHGQVFGAETRDGLLGSSVALSGSHAFLGAPGRNQVMVYHVDDTDRTQWPLQEIITPPAGTGSVEFGAAVASDSGTWLAVGAPGFDAVNTAADTGAVFLFNLTDTTASRTWRQQGRLESGEPVAGARFGAALSTLGRSLAVGAPGGRGAVHMCQGQDTGWVTEQQVWSDNSRDGEFLAPHRFAVSEGTLIVPGRDLALGAETGRIALHVFEHAGEGTTGSWRLVRRTVAPDLARADVTHYLDIAMDGDTLAIGAYRLFSDWVHPNGATIPKSIFSLYIHSRHLGGRDQWGHVKRINAPGVPDQPVNGQEPADEGGFGTGLAVTGDCILAAQSNADRVTPGLPPIISRDQGQVLVYCRHTGATDNWGLEQTLYSPDNAEWDLFGASIAADDQVLAVGMGQSEATFTGGRPVGTGAVAIFRRTGTDDNPWTFSHKITPPGGQVGDYFGNEVALDGEQLAVFNLGVDGQKLYIFERNNGGGSQWDMVQRQNVGSDAMGLSLHSGRIAYHQEAYNGQAFVTWIMVHERNTGGPDRWGRAWSSPEVETGAATSTNYDGFTALWGEHLFAGRRFGLANFKTVESFRLSRTPYETWLRAQFTDAVVENGSLRVSTWGEDADPDRDGVPNILEAAYGTNPEVANGAPDVTVEVRQGFGALQSDKFVWRWRRAAEDQGVQLRPEWSPDLVNWYLSGEGPPGNARSLDVTDLGPDSSGRHLMEVTTSISGRAWLRLRAWRQ